jgi:hypothetical protein
MKILLSPLLLSSLVLSIFFLSLSHTFPIDVEIEAKTPTGYKTVKTVRAVPDQKELDKLLAQITDLESELVQSLMEARVSVEERIRNIINDFQSLTEIYSNLEKEEEKEEERIKLEKFVQIYEHEIMKSSPRYPNPTKALDMCKWCPTICSSNFPIVENVLMRYFWCDPHHWETRKKSVVC